MVLKSSIFRFLPWDEIFCEISFSVKKHVNRISWVSFNVECLADRQGQEDDGRPIRNINQTMC